MKKQIILRNAKKWYIYYLLFLPCLVLLILFNYLPMFGIVLAFKDYWPRYGIFMSPWADPFYEHFADLFQDAYFWTTFKNTCVISGLRLLFGFPAPILLALMFNELKFKGFKKFSQTVLYIPYFLSWIVLAGMLKRILLTDGLVNEFLGFFGVGPVNFLTESGPFLAMLIVTDVWKGMGFGTIVYLAAMSGIDTSLYEAAELDGANRMQKMLHITLPGIAVAISVQLILSLSGILNGGFDQIYNLYSTPVYDVADIIDTYLYRIGMTAGEVELSTALGLFKSLIAFVLIVVTNKIANKLGGNGVW